MRSGFRWLALLGVCVAGVSGVSEANAAAKMQIYPTYIELEEGSNSAVLNVYNAGNAIGRYRASFEDYHMPESGKLKPYPEGQEAPHSVKPYLRVSPRSVSVPPGQSQKFRLLARLPRDLPDGEYRTHMSVLMSSTDVGRDQKKAQKGFGVAFEPRFRLEVPVVLKKGVIQTQTEMVGLRVEPPRNASNPPSAVVDFTHSGNASAKGTLIVTFEKNGESYELYKASRIAIYRGTPKRQLQLHLKVPEGVQLQGGTLNAVFEDEDDNIIAQKSVSL